MVAITRDFEPADRYVYDFGLCSSANGWAQLDTGQDAWYHGTWINPAKRAILAYVEGDVILTQCDTDAELSREVATIKAWNIENGHRFLGIDPGFNEPLSLALADAGLGAYFHGAAQ